MMKIKITREDGSLHSFDFYKKSVVFFQYPKMGICIIAYMGMVNLLRLSYLDGYIKN